MFRNMMLRLEYTCCHLSIYPPSWLPSFARWWVSLAALRVQGWFHAWGFDPQPKSREWSNAEINAWYGFGDGDGPG